MESVDNQRLFNSVSKTEELRPYGRRASTSPPRSLARNSATRCTNEMPVAETHARIPVTKAAERFHEGCVHIPDGLDTLEAELVSQKEPRGSLRLVAHTTAPLAWLVPLIAGFERAIRNVNLNVTLI